MDKNKCMKKLREREREEEKKRGEERDGEGGGDPGKLSPGWIPAVCWAGPSLAGLHLLPSTVTEISGRWSGNWGTVKAWGSLTLAQWFLSLYRN